MNQIFLAVINPNEFAYSIGGGPGYTGMLMGEVIYITRCNPVLVSRRPTELPITYNNQSMFMSPTYHSILSKGQEITCNNILGVQYYLEGNP